MVSCHFTCLNMQSEQVLNTNHVCMMQHRHALHIRSLSAVTDMPGLVDLYGQSEVLASQAQVQAGEGTFKMAMLHTKGRSPGSSPLQNSPTNCMCTSNTDIGDC